MLNKFLESIESEKLRFLVKALIEGRRIDEAGLDYYRLRSGFIKMSRPDFVSLDREDIVSPERYLFNMFKILFISGMPFYPETIPAITLMYMWFTRSMLHRQVKNELQENSVYNRMIGSGMFKKAMEVYRKSFKLIKPEMPSGLIQDDTTFISVCDAMSRAYMKGSVVTHISVDCVSRVSLFNRLSKKKERLFLTVKESGRVFPRTDVLDISEEGRWADL